MGDPARYTGPAARWRSRKFSENFSETILAIGD
jgi:hypothetical protein